MSTKHRCPDLVYQKKRVHPGKFRGVNWDAFQGRHSQEKPLQTKQYKYQPHLPREPYSTLLINSYVDRQSRIQSKPIRVIDEHFLINQEVLQVLLENRKITRGIYIKYFWLVHTKGHSTREPRTRERRVLIRSSEISGTTCPTFTFGTYSYMRV